MINLTQQKEFSFSGGVIIVQLGINVTFVGLTVVFLALIALLLIIMAFSRMIYVLQSKAKDSSHMESDIQPSNLEIKDNYAALQEEITDGELVAVLTAAVMSFMQKKGYKSKIRVKSFRRIPQTTPIWNAVSRSENIASKL